MGRYQDYESEKSEQSYEARIWWALWAVALAVILYTAWQQYRNFDLVHNGICVEAEYSVYKERQLAKVWDSETGNLIQSFDVSGMDARHGEDTIRLYYKDNLALAEPQRELSAWLKSYALYGLMFAGCSWKLRRIYKNKPSTEAYVPWED